MKKEVLILTFFALIWMNNMFAQNSILIFNDSFGLDKNSKNKEVDFGKTITLNGTINSSEIESIKIQYKSHMYKGTVTAKIEQNSWQAQIGPFYPNDELQLIFEVNQTLSIEKKAALKQTVKNQIDTLQESIFNNFDDINFDDQKYIIFISKLWKRNDREELKKYHTVSGKGLDVLVLESLSQNTLLGLVQSIKESRKNIQDSKDLIEKTWQQKFPDKKKINIDTLVRDTQLVNQLGQRNTIDFIKRTQDSLKKQETQIEEQIEGIIKKIIGETKLFVSENILSEVIDVSNFKNYIDLDIGASYVYIKKESQFGFMFLINMYCKKVDLEKPPKNWNDRLSVVAGLGYTPFDSLSKTPIYYLGLGIRPNPVWKANIGASFFRRIGEQDYNWNLTFGLSISLKYMTQLRKNFISPFNKQGE